MLFGVELINRVTEFISSDYMVNRINHYISKGRKWVIVNFNEVAMYDTELADTLLDYTEETIETFNKIIKTNENKDLSIRFKNIPEIQKISVWKLREKHLGKFLTLTGTISKIGDVDIISKEIKYTCLKCGVPQNYLILNNIIPKPKICACGNKSKFREIKKSVDVIKLGICDDMMEIDNKERQVTRDILCLLEKDITSTLIDEKIKPNTKVNANGYLTLIPKKRGSNENKKQFIINYLDFPEIGWQTIKTTKHIQNKIEELSKSDDILNRLAYSVSDVEGFELNKIACLLQLAGSPKLKNKEGYVTFRNTIHILFIGDTGSAKSTLAKDFGSLSPIYSYMSCANSSTRGLICAVVKDVDIGNWVIYAGVVPMAHKGIAILDELDKTPKEDYGDHNHAMNDMEVPIAKANVKGKLQTETSYLATANPKDRVFYENQDYHQQIDMPLDFLDRFDIIFPMLAPKTIETKHNIMNIIYDRHQEKKQRWNPEFSREFIQYYIGYCRQKIPEPKLPERLREVLIERMDNLFKTKDPNGKVSIRHMESIIRFAYASARLHLRQEINEYDLQIALELKYNSFKQLGIIDEKGFMQYETIAGQDKQKATRYNTIKAIFDNVLYKSGAFIEEQRFYEACEKAGYNENDVDDWFYEFEKTERKIIKNKGIITRL